MNKKRLFVVVIAFIIAAVSASAFYAFEYTPKAELIKLLTPFYVDDVSNTRERCGSNNDGGYIIPLVAINNTDAVMSYGIADNISFEMGIIKKFGLDVYAFDCGIKEAPGKDDKLHFYSECIGSDAFIYKWQKSSQKISSYNDQIKKLKLEHKRIYMKMDIDGSEYESFEGIPDSLFITIQGITIELHSLKSRKVRVKAIKLLKTFNNYFTLIHVHGNNFEDPFPLIGKNFPRVIELTYISNNYVKSKRISDENFPTPLDRPNDSVKSDLLLDYWK
jgi:hypothetical protein